MDISDLPGYGVAQDALDHLVRTISAHGDVLAMGDPDDLADGAMPMLVQAIHDAAIEVGEILDQPGAQRLVPLPRPRTGVSEDSALTPWGCAPGAGWSAGSDVATAAASPVAEAEQTGRARLH